MQVRNKHFCSKRVVGSKIMLCFLYYSKKGNWCYVPATCPEGLTFDDAAKVCVSGSCPQGHNFENYYEKKCVKGSVCRQKKPEIPDGDGWSCKEQDEEHVRPADCGRYYSCHKCNTIKGWCVEEHNCSEGYTYDESRKECIKGRCPQFPEILPPTWSCKSIGEK